MAETLKKLMALPRYASADEIAAMVAYLAGPEAGFVTGASLMIDGGFTAYEDNCHNIPNGSLPVHSEQWKGTVAENSSP